MLLYKKMRLPLILWFGRILPWICFDLMFSMICSLKLYLLSLPSLPPPRLIVLFRPSIGLQSVLMHFELFYPGFQNHLHRVNVFMALLISSVSIFIFCLYLISSFTFPLGFVIICLLRLNNSLNIFSLLK